MYEGMLNDLNSIINKEGIEFTVHGVLGLLGFHPEIKDLFLLKIYNDKREMVVSFIDEYLRHFLDDNLNPKGINEYFGFTKSVKEVSNLIETNIEKYDKKEFWVSPVVKTKKGNKLLDEEIRFYDSLMFLKKYRCIDFLDSDFKSIEISDTDRKYILNVRIKPLCKPSKFYDQYKHLIHNKDIAFEIDYDDNLKVISIIDLEKGKKTTIKGRMNNRSVKRVIFEYLFKNTGESISYDILYKEVEDKIKKELKSSYLPKAVYNLGFKGIFKDLFFPEVSPDYIKFRKIITKEELKDKKINLSKVIQNLNKKQ